MPMTLNVARSIRIVEPSAAPASPPYRSATGLGPSSTTWRGLHVGLGVHRAEHHLAVVHGQVVGGRAGDLGAELVARAVLHDPLADHHRDHRADGRRRLLVGERRDVGVPQVRAGPPPGTAPWILSTVMAVASSPKDLLKPAFIP